MKTIATVGGLGYFPVASGTLGSAVGMGLIWILRGSPIQQVVGALAAIGLGLWSAGPAARAMKNPDPHPVIIDEVAGMMLALIFLPVRWPVYLAGFLLFRLLDILKPGPIRWVERLPGSWGIMLDDLLAGLLTNGILHLVCKS